MIKKNKVIEMIGPWKGTLTLLLIYLCVLGCGNIMDTSQAPSTTSSQNTNSTDPSPSNSVSSSPISTPVGLINSTPYTLSVNLTGSSVHSGTPISVTLGQTDSLLQLGFTSGPTGTIMNLLTKQKTGTFTYNCVSFDLAFNGYTQRVFVPSNTNANTACLKSGSSGAKVDLSNLLARGSAVPFVANISNIQTDACNLQGNLFRGGCNLLPLLYQSGTIANHPIEVDYELMVNISVQTNYNTATGAVN